jgi:hypothetical protein
VATVLSSGYSQGAGAQLELLAEGLDPGLVYDGHLIQMIGLACFKREDVAPHFGFFGDCRPLPTNGRHAPVIVLASEADMLIFRPTVLGFGKSAFFTRNPANPNWRQYEMAGISHLPEPILPLGLPNQNTGDARPIFRAALEHLTRWTTGRHRESPPPSRYFSGSVDATDVFVPMTDADGHFAAAFACRTSSPPSTDALPVRRSVVTRRSTHSDWIRSTRSCSSAGPSRDSATMSCWSGIGRGSGT